uniref:VP1054 n=1 Tax=Phthorimaea operculella granulovirus TaxID=192584 RepID=A0A481SF99_9BBAC|nr:VP1054 [Phthorimaea operculella granulovirus]QBH67390.1 VP1054 [Phthorimaea operculella granulovirus]
MTTTQQNSSATVVYRSVNVAKKRCRFHPEAQCILEQKKGLTKTHYKHYTYLDTRYCSINTDPYYEWLLFDDIVRTHYLINNITLMCCVQFEDNVDDKLRAVEKAGEYNFEIIRHVLKYINQYVYNVCGDLNSHAKTETKKTEQVYVLLTDMYVQCLYSPTRCIILPIQMYCIYKDGMEPFINDQMYFNTVPEYEDATLSQDVYKTFIVYNTVLTMMLKSENPFNDRTKVISKIIESVGTCNGGIDGAKRNRIKICELEFGGEPPGHIFCPPKDMVRKIYKYSKWCLNPKNYRRYFEILAAVDSDKNRTLMKEWHDFVSGLNDYFSINK